MTAVGIGNGTNSQIALNDWWGEGWEDDKKPRASHEYLIFKNNTVALNDWWGEGWEDSKRPPIA